MMRATGGRRYRLALAFVAVCALAALARPAGVAQAHAGDHFSFSSSTYQLFEGQQLTIVINKSVSVQPSNAHLVTLQFGAGGDTAINGQHYGFINTPCTFQSPAQVPIGAAQSSGEFRIQTCNNSDVGNKTFTVTMTVDNGGLVGISEATVTILDDDGQQPAVITSISPTSGTTAGGTLVTISGSNFIQAAFNHPVGPCPSVMFGALPASSCQFVSANTIRAVSPAQGAGVVEIVANNGNGPSIAFPETANDFIYVTPGQPVIQSITPASGQAGVTATITGVNFASPATVTFGGTFADNVTVVNSTTITATVPVPTSLTRPLPVNVVVTSNAQVSNDFSFTYVDVVVTSLSPSSGPPGTPVTITGSGFTSTPTVRFGSVVAQVQSFTATTIVAIAPVQAAQVVDVTVSIGLVTSANTPADNFAYTQGVSVTNLDPRTGPTAGGNTVTITGSGFLAGSAISVSFGGTPATGVTRLSDTQIQVVAPARAAGVVSVIVTVNGVSSPDTDADNYTYAAVPVITSINPPSGNAGGTTIVTITGLNFTEGAIVRFGEIIATRTIVSDTQINAVAPSTAPPGTVDVTVTNAAGTSAKGPHTLFTFLGMGGLPTITSLLPNQVPLNTAGVEITISGANFSVPATVTFGTEQGTNVQVLSSTQIRATAPLRSVAGVVEVIVTTNAGSSSTLGTANDLTYGTAGPGPGSGELTSYQLFVRFTLITWDGRDNIAVGDALRGQEFPDVPATNNVINAVTAVFYWSDNGAGCTGGTACWLGFFPSGVGVPGANNLAALLRGRAYWVAVSFNLTWTVQRGQ